MKTMESVYGHNKYRHALTSNSYYQQPPIPHPRNGTLRPQSEYGFGGLGAPYSSRYSRGGGGGGSSGGSGGSADWPPWGAPLGAPLAGRGKGRARPCSALLAAAALLAALAVFAVAGLALYMGAFRSDTSEPILAFEGRFRLRRSVAAGSLAGAPPNAPRLESALRRACAPRLGPALVTLQMVDFNADKLTAFFRIYLDRRKVEGPIDELGEIIANILVENSITKNSQLRQLNVDPASISIKRDNEHTFKADMLGESNHPAENKASLPMLPQNTKEKVLQTRMGVIRKTAVTPMSVPTPSVKVKQHTLNNDEPDINVDELPVIQGSFQITKTEADITENKKKVESSNREPPRMSSKPSIVKETPTTKKSITEPIKHISTTTKPTVITNPPSTSATSRTKSTTPYKTQTSAPTTEKIKSEIEIQADDKLSDLPKLDTLFAVPSYVDQEPWKPIQPGDAFSTLDLNKPMVVPSHANVDAEDRVGIAEVSEDVPTIEGVINANEFPANFRIDQDYKEHFENNFSIDNNFRPASTSHEYSEDSPAPVYTSFKRPEFSPTFKESQTLGSNYPMPHPLPVNKLVSNPENENTKPFEPIDSISEVFHNTKNTQNKYATGIPLKDRLSTVSINVEPFSNTENAEYVNLNGGVIIRKHNSSNSTKIKTNSPQEGTDTQFKNDLVNIQSLGNNNTNSIPGHPESPSLFTNQMTWELINETGNDHSKLKNIPNKSFNETLQAVITKNEEDIYRPLKNVTDNASNLKNVNNILRNITTIFTKLAASLRRPTEVEPAKNIEEKTSTAAKHPTEDSEEIMSAMKSPKRDPPTRVQGAIAPPRRPTKINREPVLNLQETNNEMLSNGEKKDDEPLSFHGQGSIEPVDMSIQELLLKEKESLTPQTSSTVIVPTLLPVKSNSGIGRPLRPRPKIPNNNDESRGFSNAKPFPFFSEMKSFINNLHPENVVSINVNKSINDSELTFLDATNNTNAIKSAVSITEMTSTYPTTSIKTDVVTSISSTKNLPPPSENNKENLNSSAVILENVQENKTEKHNNIVRDHTRKIDISEKFRLPKTHPSEDVSINDKFEKSFENSNKTFVLPTATEFFLTHPSTQAIQLMEKVKTIIKGLENSNITDMIPTAPSFIAPIESYKDFSPKNISFPFNNTQTANFKIDLKQNSSEKEFNKTDQLNDKINANFPSIVETSVANKTNVILTNEDILNIIKNISAIKIKNSTRILDRPTSISSLNGSSVSSLTNDKLKDLANIATITDSHNNSFFGTDEVLDDTVISTKAVSSSYTVNNAGFKILTKTFNKIPGNFKDDEKKINKFYNEPTSPVVHENTQLKESDDCARNNLTVMCSNGQCLPETARCNRLLDCPKGEDEAECTCADYLRSQFLLRKICDGILDCWDFSDENNCEWCNPDQYVCSNSRQCIDKDKVCDGHKDCPQGDDERQCVTVAMSQKDAQAYPYSKEGYIMVQKQGRWGRLCVQNFDKVIARSQSTLQIADLGRAVCRAMTYVDYENIDRVIEEGPEAEKHYFSLHYGSRGNGGRGGLAFRKSGCSRGQVAKVVCSNLQCGARPQAASQQARIVGGGNAGAGAWPWQAALYKEGDFQCGATLISDRWLISAGHCFYHAQEDFWVARLGALRRGTTFPSPYEQLQPISSVILHPGYIDSGFINDIALLKTANKVAFSDYVRPICLPPPGSEVDDNRRCTVVGWGQLFEVGRIFPDTLQEVELPVISTGECRKRTLFLPLYRITEDMFCAGFDRGGRDACLGDSGGPLMCQEQDNQWYLYGVTSNGYGCARANRPGVYTKVANYVNWVQTTMQVYDDRSFDHPRNRQQLSSNRSASGDMEVAETRNFHRHVDKCRGHRCPLGECLPPTRVCNGFMECSDGSDEKDC